MVGPNSLKGTVKIVAAALMWVWLAPAPAHTDVRLPHVIGSHMVVQRDAELPVWGWADPGEKVTVRIAPHEKSAEADRTGKWMVRLPALTVGSPRTMTITGKNTIVLEDIMVGEVWLCSGQSNMELRLQSVKRGGTEVATAYDPQIRLFHVGRKTAASPAEDVDASWRPCTPESVTGFSAVAYFFGRELRRELNVPIGLIQSTWGGTRIEPWTPPVGFAAVESLGDVVEIIENAAPTHDAAARSAVHDVEAWLPLAKQALAEGQAVVPPPAWPKHPLDSKYEPTGIYNAMIHPLVPFAIRGVIWYQGESNVADGMAYLDKMKALITGWRTIWGQGDFPFYYVQIAPFYGPASLFEVYTGDQLPRLWEAQSDALQIPNTGMVVTNDIGDLDDIHPRNKQDVGRRLALWALAKTYGREGLVHSGPIYESMTIETSRIRVRFDHVGTGLTSRDGKPLTWFTIAGADGRFVKATAKVDGDDVVVWSDQTPQPVAVRFAWDMTAEPNLMNKQGLPAASFRTDEW